MKQSTFVAALKFASHAAAQKDIRYYLNGVCVELAGDRMILVGTDGHRMAYVELDDDNSGCERGPQWIIPAATVKVLLSMFKAGSTGHMGFEFTADTVTISGPSGVLPFKPLEGKFPDWRRVCKSGAEPVAVPRIGVNSNYLADALKAAGALSGSRPPAVSVQFHGESEAMLVMPSTMPTGVVNAAVVVMPCRL